jgi:hypothetical protein
MITNDDIAKLKGWIRRDESEWHLGEIYDYSYFVDSLGQYANGDVLPNWTGDIAEAKKLQEEMRPHFFCIFILCWDHTDKRVCQCEYRQGHTKLIQPLTGDGNSESAAICEAYAKWKGEK